MTNELQKQFFETFEIEPVIYDFIEPPCQPFKPIKVSRRVKVYPITDRQYLELLCILGEHDERYSFNTVENLKKTVLNELIAYYKWCLTAEFKGTEEWAEDVKTQIQKIFKGE